MPSHTPPTLPTRRRVIATGVASTALTICRALPAQTAVPGAATPRRARLMLAGPFASVSFPLMRIADSGALADVAERVEFVSWKNPDQLRALAIERSADFVAMPSNVAANLYNCGVPLRLLDISVWGLLWMVSREDGLRTLADFRGKEVVMPFRGDMPDIVVCNYSQENRAAAEAAYEALKAEFKPQRVVRHDDRRGAMQPAAPALT